MPREYAGNVRFAPILILSAALACGVARQPLAAQDQGQPSAPRDRMFSGTVTSISDTSLTVASTGSKESKTFLITPQTRFEGPKPQVKSRVDIRYVSTDEGERAVRVIVRGASKK